MLLSIHVCRDFKLSLLSFTIFFLGIQDGYSQKTYGLLKKLNGNDENGYVLFSPLNCDTTYLINKCGKRVHHWVSEHPPGMSVYLLPNGHLLKSGTDIDTSFKLAGGRGGVIEEFDWNNNLVWRYKLFNDSLCQHHDIRPMPNGNILVLAWHSIGKSEAMSLGRRNNTFALNQNDLWGERLIEIKPIGTDSAEIVWQWDVFDHIIQDLDTALPNFGNIANHPERININYALTMQTNDWLHANGIDYNEKLDQIVISIHNFSEFWIIDHSTTLSEASTHKGGVYDRGGDLLYRWGNPQAYNMGTTSDRKLFRQHNAHWIKDGLQDSGCIMVFNNGWDRDTAYSTVEVVQTPILLNGSYNQNLPFGPATSKWIYKDSIPKNFYSQIISGAERLPNGNTMICSGVQGTFFEVTPQKKTVWKYNNPVYGTGVRSDGGKDNNYVFRCSFYPSDYAAFVGRVLTPGAALEKNSMPYSCDYETVAPVVSALAPLKNSQNVAVDSTLVIKMSEAVLQVNATITIFANGYALESIGTSSDLVQYKGNEIWIRHNKKFPFNARIGVKIPVKYARDSSFNFTNKAIDTVDWHFDTRRQTASLTFISPDSGAVNVKLDEKPYIIFDQRVHKLNAGGVSLFEDGKLLEYLPVTSSRIKVSGNVVEIYGTSFDYDKSIMIQVDSCFADTFGSKVKPIGAGRWVFSTLTRPKVSSVTPVLNSKHVGVYATLTMEFDRYMRLDSNKKINIYKNGQLFESLPLNSNEVSLNGNILSIQLSMGMPGVSRIAIEVPGNALIDNYGTYFAGSDSSQWAFDTDIKSSVETKRINTINIYPNPVSNAFVLISDSDIHTLTLVDQLGRNYEMVLEGQSENTYTVPVGDMPSGFYAVVVNGVVEMRLLKL